MSLQEWADVIADFAAAVGILGVAIWAWFRFNLTAFFRPVVELDIAREALLEADGSKLVALRLTIKNVCNVRAELLSATLDVVEVHSPGESHLMTVANLHEKAVSGNHGFSIEWRTETGQAPIDEIFNLGLDWETTGMIRQESEIVDQPGDLLSLVAGVSPGEEDSMLVPCRVSTDANALDVNFQIEIRTERLFFLIGPRARGGRWYSYGRCLIDLAKTPQAVKA